MSYFLVKYTRLDFTELNCVFVRVILVQLIIVSLLGKFFSVLFPDKKRQLENSFTISTFGQSSCESFVDRCIRRSILDTQLASNGSTNTELLHQKFWQHQKPEQWFDQTADRLESIHKPIIEPHLHKTLPELQALKIKTVVELGCGNGAWLAHLKTVLTEQEKFVGIDISSEQIEQNQKRYPELDFHSSDLLGWVKSNPMDHVLYLTNCGVLEYLSQSSVESLYKCIQARGKNQSLFLVEPVDVTMDLELPQDSILFGDEHSHSHHHTHLLTKAGFRIFYQKSIEVEGYRLLVIAAQPKV